MHCLYVSAMMCVSSVCDAVSLCVCCDVYVMKSVMCVCHEECDAVSLRMIYYGVCVISEALSLCSYYDVCVISL